MGRKFVMISPAAIPEIKSPVFSFIFHLAGVSVNCAGGTKDNEPARHESVSGLKVRKYQDEVQSWRGNLKKRTLTKTTFQK